MMRCLILSVLLAASASAQTPPLEFKGVPFNSTIAELLKAHPKFRCLKSQCLQFRDGATFADEPVVMIDAYFVAGLLADLRISYSPESFGIIAQVLASKYGPPTDTKVSEFKTQGGLTAQQDVRVWLFANGDTIVLKKYAGSIDSASLVMGTLDGIADREDAARKRVEKAKKDI